MTHDELATIALRYDTAMSRAMLRALGVEARKPVRYGVVVTVDRFDGIEECFAQRHGIAQ